MASPSPASDKGTGRRILLRLGLAGVLIFLLLQLVPYGWSHSNPPVTQAAAWPDTDAEAIARSACYDCHSNETEWPVYSYVAPMSWLVRRDVDAGRAAMNLSELDQDGGEELDDAADEIEDGTMPPRQYQLAHPEARLSDTERQRLAEAFDQLEETIDADDRDDDNSGPG